MFSSSISRRLIWMSPAMTMPLSRTRSRMSARFAGPGSRGCKSARPYVEGGNGDDRSGSRAATGLALIGLVAVVAATAAITEKLAVLIYRHFIGTEHVGRRRNPR